MGKGNLDLSRDCTAPLTRRVDLYAQQFEKQICSAHPVQRALRVQIEAKHSVAAALDGIMK